MAIKFDQSELEQIDELVHYFVSKNEVFKRAENSLLGYFTISTELRRHIHSVKSRIKDPEHLKGKLIRKMRDAKERGASFDISKENLFLKITDLVGFRIMHLHTKQIEQINIQLKNILQEEQWQIIEGPMARTWDEESERYFEEIGIDVHQSPNLNLYTSVHYVIRSNSSPGAITCEIQVRTLMEEVWGEVDHAINYPEKSDSFSCREQIKVLARATSSCSRLVDSIFSTYNYEFTSKKKE
jgi:putative GTP pyrophosphokinase